MVALVVCYLLDFWRYFQFLEVNILLRTTSKNENENTDGDGSDLFIYFLKLRHICRKDILSGLAKINQINETTFKREHFCLFHILFCTYFHIFIL